MDVEQIIILEHIALTKAFDQFLPLCHDLTSWQLFVAFCDKYLEKNHHAKEEKFIFSAVRSDSRIRMGGPLCTLYFDQYLQSPAIARAQKVIQDILSTHLFKQKIDKEKIDELIKPQWGEDFALDISTNSPLLIPAGDHVAGRMLLHFADTLLALENGAADGVQTALISSNNFELSLKTIFFHYREIQVDHFVREEKCFLKMCQSLILADDWSNIAHSIIDQYPLITDDLLTKHFAKAQ